MNTDIDVFVEGDAAPVAAFIETRLLFEQQEARFSRFRPESMLSRMNRGETIDDPWMETAIELAIEAHDQTRGLFNPMVLPALAQAGYDRSFERISGGAPMRSRVPGPGDCLARGTGGWSVAGGAIDLGGIVKGWTADLAVDHLAGRFDGVFVNAGGDIRVAGAEDGLRGWKVEVDGPGGGITWAGVIDGAVATSSVLKRRWTTAGGQVAHHLIDPRTGMPAESPFVQVTVRATTCTWAEVWAKAVLIGGHEGLDLTAAYRLDVLALAPDGTRTTTGDW